MNKIKKLNFITILRTCTVYVHVYYYLHLSVHIHSTAVKMYLAITTASWTCGGYAVIAVYSDSAFYMHASETTHCCTTPGSLPVPIDDGGPYQLVPAHSMPVIWWESEPVLSSPNMWRKAGGPQYRQAVLSQTLSWLQNVSLNAWKTEHKLHEDGTASLCAP